MTSVARWGVVLLPQSLAGFEDLSREVEAHGFDWLGVADSQSVFREMYVALTIAALNTSRVRLGPLVTNPLTRHLVVTASAISTVDELSAGRAALGIGSGDSAITTIGAPPATVAGLEDAVVTLGRLTAGASVDRGGRRWQVRRSKRRVPIYLAAEGPRTLELAGRVADGVIVGLGLTPDVIRLSLAAIERGAKEVRIRPRWLDTSGGTLQRRSALRTELMIRGILVLAPGTLHAAPPESGLVKVRAVVGRD